MSKLEDIKLSFVVNGHKFNYEFGTAFKVDSKSYQNIGLKEPEILNIKSSIEQELLKLLGE